MVLHTLAVHRILGEILERSFEVVKFEQFEMVVIGHDDVFGIPRHVNDLSFKIR